MREKSTSLNVRLSPEELDSLQKKADEMGMTVSSFIRMISKSEVKVIVQIKKED
ncbi:plasmid mobilization protein [Acidaminobacter hydrogenoformans]|uniref:Ribbon-helix-helix protein, copG family n=1 Tax=Acidaminobacter hydrogenoformans DSM 2784 TaxID=1120920 RepID=A0A1G5S6Y3_9FIRM|nr:ribbon-helix-helix protein, CopG family [Acidaminobacter hydrogenoformans]SCZ82086.1 Ribbon-helix-helix protein, copG family [Acidaminobacter hydrogenoformans DSM 2784]